MSVAKPKKNSPAKCRKSAAPIEGQDWVRIGGARWLREVAIKEGKHIPLSIARATSPSRRPWKRPPLLRLPLKRSPLLPLQNKTK